MKKYINSDCILLGLLVLACVYVGYNNWKITDNEIEQRIFSHGLNSDRDEDKIWGFTNPSGKGICLMKNHRNPSAEITADGDQKKENSQLCGPITTARQIRTGDAVTIGNKYIPLRYLFAEKLKKDMPEFNLKTGDYICVAVEKLSHLPEYETKGPWFTFPGCKPFL